MDFKGFSCMRRGWWWACKTYTIISERIMYSIEKFQLWKFSSCRYCSLYVMNRISWCKIFPGNVHHLENIQASSKRHLAVRERWGYGSYNGAHKSHIMNLHCLMLLTKTFRSVGNRENLDRKCFWMEKPQNLIENNDNKYLWKFQKS